MFNKKRILVTGATGAQGGSVARALLQNDEFAVRILTRNATAENALALQQLGAEIAVGDMNDGLSLEEAMEGCYGVFGITDYFEHHKKEYSLGMNLIEAVAVSGIRHFVLHTMPDYRALSGGELEVPQCDIKADLKGYCQELRLRATYLQVSFYYENFLQRFPLRQDQFGTFQFGFPQGQTRLAMVSVEDIGHLVAAIFLQPEACIGRTITAVGDDNRCSDYAETMSGVLEIPVQYNHVPRELYRCFGMPDAEEWANLFDVQRQFVSNRRKELEECCRLYSAMQGFESWLVRNKKQFLTALQGRMIEEQVY